MFDRIFGKKQEQWMAFMLFALLVILLIPLFMIARYAVPSVDDYAYATLAGYGHGDSYGFGEIMWMEFRNAYSEWKSWQGLYFINYISFVINALFMQEYYWMTILFTLGFFVVAEFVLGNVIMKYGFGVSNSLAAIWLIPCIILQILLMPSPVEAFFWMCSGVIYTTMLSITCLYFALQVYLLCNREICGIKAFLVKISIALGTIMVGGSNYLCMMLILGIGACIIIYAAWTKRKTIRFFIGNYVLFIACMLLCVLSPGSANRQASSGEGLSALEAILRSFVESFRYIRAWTIVPVGVLLLFLIPVAWRIVSVRKYRYPWPALFSMGTYCIYSMLFTPNLYALGIIGAYRSQNIYRIALYVLLFTNLLYWTGYIRRILEQKGFLQKKIWKSKTIFNFAYFGVTSIVVLGLVLYYGGSTVTSLSAYRSLRNGTAQAYYDTYQQRLEVLEDASVKDAELEPYVDAPYVLFFGDITKDAEAWENVAMAEFYHKNSVFLKQ